MEVEGQNKLLVIAGVLAFLFVASIANRACDAELDHVEETGEILPFSEDAFNDAGTDAGLDGGGEGEDDSDGE